MPAMMAPAKRFLKAIRLPSNAATKANTAINATNSQFTVDKSIGIFLLLTGGCGNASRTNFGWQSSRACNAARRPGFDGLLSTAWRRLAHDVISPQPRLAE